MGGVYSFFKSMAGSQVPMCGNGTAYQVNVQKSLNPHIRLLEATPEDEPGYDKALTALVTATNTAFEVAAVKALLDRRKALVKAGKGDEADRLEVTILLTDRGLQLAFSHAMEQKIDAPTPKRHDGLFGWLMPKKRFAPAMKSDAASSKVAVKTKK